MRNARHLLTLSSSICQLPDVQCSLILPLPARREFLGDDDERLFWQYLDTWQSPVFPNGTTDQACISKFLEIGSHLMGPTLAPLLHLSLSMRSMSPKVVLYRQLAQESLRRAGLGQADADGDGWQVGENPVAPGGCCWLDVGEKDLLVGEEKIEKWLQLLSPEK